MSWSPNKYLFKSFIHSVSTDQSVSQIKKAKINSKLTLKAKIPTTNIKPEVPIDPKFISPITYNNKSNQHSLNLFTKGCSELENKNPNEAVKFFVHILKEDPKDFASLVNFATCKIHMKEYQRALDLLQQVTEIEPFNEVLVFNKAFVLIALGEYERALVELDVLKDFFGNVSEEYTKLRTFAIFHCGKVSTAIRDIDDVAGYTNRTHNRFDQIHSRVQILKPPQRKMKSSVHSSKDNFDFVTFIPNRDKSLNMQQENSPSKSSSPEKKVAKNQKNFQRFNSNSKLIPKISAFHPNHQSSNKDLLVYTKESRKSPNKSENKKKTIKSPGFYQKDLSSNSPDFLETETKPEAKEKIQRINTQVSDYFEKILAATDYLKHALESPNITEQDLKFLLQEFSLQPAERNFPQIDEILLKLDFFNKYGQEIRYPIYKFSSIKQFPADSIVFNQGDVADNLYIIIQGSVTVIKSSEEFRNHSVAISSIYAGQHFGDVALINALKSNPFVNRTATIKTSESCHFLSVPKSNYQDLLLNLQLKNLQKKTIFLSELKFFKGVDPVSLIPLACNLHETKFGVKEKIFDKGHVPEGVIIVYQGQAKLVSEGSFTQKCDNPYAVARSRKKFPSFVSGNYPGVQRPLKSFSCSDDIPSSQSPIKTKTPQDHSVKVIKEQTDFFTLFIGDFCGGRALVSEKISPSKFSLISDSPNTSILTLTKNHLFYLPQSIKDTLKIVLQKSHEPDCPAEIDSKTMEKLQTHWQDYRQNLVQHIQQVNYLDKHRYFK